MRSVSLRAFQHTLTQIQRSRKPFPCHTSEKSVSKSFSCHTFSILVQIGTLWHPSAAASSGNWVAGLRSLVTSLVPQQLSRAQPVHKQHAPLADRWILKIQAHPVRSVLKDVQLGGNASLTQRQIKRHAVFRRHHRIRGRTKQKCRRRL